MSNRLQLKGKRFYRLIVLSLHSIVGGRSYWSCKCTCGKSAIIGGKKLVSGHTRSCGCLKRERTAEANRKRATHNESGKTIEYQTWVSMICRCNKPRKYYFDRGIRVCRRWKKYENFLKDMGRRPSSGYSIERINNDIGYQPSNCKWATMKEQAGNRRPVPRAIQLKVKRAGDFPRRLALHIRWHVKRNLKKEGCTLCARRT